jgi:dipeptidyl-peptidase-4
MNDLDLHLHTRIPSGLAWSPDGNHLAYQVSGPTGSDLRLYSCGDASDHLLHPDLPPFRLYLDLPEIRWSSDGQRIVYRSGSGFHACDLATGSSPQPVFTLEGARLPQVSPDLRWVSFIQEGDIWVVPLAGGSPRRLTHAEGFFSSEWDLFNRLRQWPQWSPDSQRIAFVSPIKTSMVAGVVDLDGTLLRLDSGEGGWGMLTLDWSPDSRHLALARLSVDTCRKELALVSLEDCSEVCLWLDEDSQWVDHSIHASFDTAWSPDGQQLAFLSNRSGWRHVYLASLPGSTVRQVTFDDYECYWVGWSPDSARLALISGRDHLQSRDLWLLEPRTGAAQPLSHGGLVSGGWFLRQVNVAWSPQGDRLACVFSASRQLPSLRVFSISGATQPDEVYTALPAGAGPDFAMQIEPVQFSALDGLPLYGALLTAPGLDRAHPCPALVFAYGAWDMEAQLGWDYGPKNLLFNYLARRGFAILVVDPRGSEGYGHAHAHAQFREGGRKQCDDLAAAAAFLASLGWVDARRIALFGYSYGGYLVLQTMLHTPGVFAAGVSMAPVTEWNHYAAGSPYANVRFGRPDEDPNPLTERSPLYAAARWQGALLLLHGEQDFNVPIVFSQMFAKALAEHARRFEFIPYPGEGHVWTRPETIRDFLERMARFLETEMQPTREEDV